MSTDEDDAPTTTEDPRSAGHAGVAGAAGPGSEAARLGTELSDAVVMFHEALGALMGLSAGDHKALGMIRRSGPMPARELARLTGLTPGAVTGLVDRLVAAGYVRRTPHATDRRRLAIEATAPAAPDVVAALAGMGEAMAGVTARFTDDELRVVARWVTLTSATLREQAAVLSDRTRSR